MKINIANPATGAQRMIEIDEEKRLRALYDRRISQEVLGDDIGDEFKGYIFEITGGNDKQGFAMMQGVLINHRVKLLLSADKKCYRSRRDGERKRKSVRGCIVGPDMAIVNLIIKKKGEQELPGLTDVSIPNMRGPKRASKIRKLFGLEKGDDVCKAVIPRTFETKKGKTVTKRPKIQRLITPVVLQRKRHRLSLKRASREKAKREAAEYAKLYHEQSGKRRTALLNKGRA